MANGDLLHELIAELLMAIHGLSGYPVPEQPPAVVSVPHATLEEMACDRPCEVYGWFPGGTTIFLDDRLDPAGDVGAAGILVHELVHFLQQESGRFADRRSCSDWVKREQEAYLVQGRWLRRRQASSGPPVGVGLPPWRLIACEDKTPRGDD